MSFKNMTLDVSLGVSTNQRCASASLASAACANVHISVKPHIQECHVGGLELAMAGTFTPWKLAQQGFIFFLWKASC